MAVPTSTVQYAATGLTVPVGSTLREFQALYEKAVPTWSQEKMMALVERRVSWQEMIDLVNAEAQWGFIIYNKIDTTPVVRLAGDQASAVNYLMGNHTIMERMYRYEPAVFLYAPLHAVIWSRPVVVRTSPLTNLAASSPASATRRLPPWASNWTRSWRPCLTILASGCPTNCMGTEHGRTGRRRGWK